MAATDMQATMEGLFRVVFLAWSMPRLYNEGHLPLEESLEMAVRRVGGWCEMVTNLRGSEPRSRGTSTGDDTAD
jgi:hypothetical protein